MSSDIKVKPELKIEALKIRNSKSHPIKTTFSQENIKFLILAKTFYNIEQETPKDCTKLLDPRSIVF